MAAELLERFADIRLTATDYDDSMVEVARDRLLEFGDRAVEYHVHKVFTKLDISSRNELGAVVEREPA